MPTSTASKADTSKCWRRIESFRDYAASSDERDATAPLHVSFSGRMDAEGKSYSFDYDDGSSNADSTAYLSSSPCTQDSESSLSLLDVMDDLESAAIDTGSYPARDFQLNLNNGASDQLDRDDLVTVEQSINALQQLIQELAYKQSCLPYYDIVYAQPATMEAIDQMRSYRVRNAATSNDAHEKHSCHLCASHCARLTVLHPCRHLACATCLMTGVNLVTSSPPRPHVCARCRVPVDHFTFARSSDYDELGQSSSISAVIKSRHESSAHILMIDNMPWDANYEEIVAWLAQESVDTILRNDIALAVHVPINISTGKTANCCFMQCVSADAAMQVVRERNNARFKGRAVNASLSGFRDLLAEMFVRSMQSGPCANVTAVGNSIHRLPMLLQDGEPGLKRSVSIIDYAASVIQLADQANFAAIAGDLEFMANELGAICAKLDADDVVLHGCMKRLWSAISRCSLLTLPKARLLLETNCDALEQIEAAGKADQSDLMTPSLPNDRP